MNFLMICLNIIGFLIDAIKNFTGNRIVWLLLQNERALTDFSNTEKIIKWM